MRAAAVLLCSEETYLQRKRVRFIGASIKQHSIERMIIYQYTQVSLFPLPFPTCVFMSSRSNVCEMFLPVLDSCTLIAVLR